MRLCARDLSDFGLHRSGYRVGRGTVAAICMTRLCAWPAAAQDQYQLRHQQEMLTWTTHYEGLIDGRPGAETNKAIERFRKSIGSTATGPLTPAEIKELDKQGGAKRTRAGFRQITDNVAGVSVGVPLSYVTETKATKWGKHWYGKVAGLAIDTLRFTDFTLDQLYEKTAAPSTIERSPTRENSTTGS